MLGVQRFGCSGGSSSTPIRNPDSGFSSNGSLLFKTVVGTSEGESPLVFAPLIQRFLFLKLETEQDDLSWFTKGSLVRGEQVVLSDSEIEVQGVGVVAGSEIPTRAKGDDVVMVDASALVSPEPVN
ncbi:hypothetical protein FNV43_RR17044 [Rhamnella rubrinervis]|uniref:Uncharacterized protein n=1 Tax=Rhamnella rubrinervis TaxID=2594499 RepID=A0A8K0MEE0_9ROSA|nr:hypothetical protein FNV43_RR17044 [Rhamnella rubrinervis]